MSGKIFSIGYGNRRFDAFVSLLLEHNVQYLIDVRSRPYSRNPDYVKQRIKFLLQQDSIIYVFMGDTLGGRPSSDDQYDSSGKISYAMMAKTPHYIKGIGRIRKAVELGLNIALMCSEGRPEDCHRSKLIGETLRSYSINVEHIDESGKIITQDDAIARIDPSLLQPDLFGKGTNALTSRKIYGRPKDNGVK